MKIKNIRYILPIDDLYNDSLDGFVTLDDGYCMDEFSYWVEVTTPQNLSALIEKSGLEFVSPGYPYIIVSKLTKEIIKTAIQAFIDEQDDAYWLRLYHITATLEIEDINKVLDQKNKEAT